MRSGKLIFHAISGGMLDFIGPIIPFCYIIYIYIYSTMFDYILITNFLHGLVFLIFCLTFF